MSTETPEQITTAADAEVTDAEQLLAGLEQRVRDGDQEVTVGQVEEARGLRRFAQLRRDAAQKRAQAAEQERIDIEVEQRLDAFLASVSGLDADAMQAAVRRAEEALFELAQMAGRYNAAVNAGIPRLAGKLAADSRHDVTADYQHLTVRVGATVYVPVAESVLMDRAVSGAKQRHFLAEQERQRAITKR